MRDALLRTFASVPPAARVLSVETGHAGDLAKLGFEVWTAGRRTEDERRALAEAFERADDRAMERVSEYPDAHFDWAALSLGFGIDRSRALRDVHRVLRPGAWVWVHAAGGSPDHLETAAATAGLAIAQAPVSNATGAHGIFRRVGEGVNG